ncbi:MAG TPA: hypothetical protein VLA03_10835, partial [Draconibacterium sp.]|nr:hypothetical protein [Draconibacterium sp.]
AGLFFEIREYYINNSQLQCNLLNFFTRTLIHSSNYEVIKEIHIEFEKKISVINSHTQLPTCLSTFSVVVQDAFRTNLQFKNELAPWICNSNLGKILYT